MVSLSNGSLIIFYGVAALTFLWAFIRDKQWTQISFKGLANTWKMLLAVLVPPGALFIAAQAAGLHGGPAGLLFLPAYLITFALERINIPSWQRAILLLTASVGACQMLGADAAASVTGMAGGLLLAKLTNTMLASEQFVLEDVLPSLVWLTVVIWSKLGGGSADATIQQQLVLGTLSTTMLLRWVQNPLLHEDKVYLKRIMLSLVGGLAVLCVIMKVITALSFPKLAIVAGVGYLFSYLLETGDRSKDEPSLRSFKQLVLVGILTIAASRLFGMLGLLVLAAAMPVVTVRSTAALAAAFWVSRVLCQEFIVDYDPNVTGVNLTHSYVSAGLYAGFVLVAIFSLFLRDIKSKWLTLAIAMALSIFLPVASSFFIHAEPTASLLISATVASVLVVIFAPAFYQQATDAQDTLALLPALMSTAAILSGDVIELGVQASNHDRLVAVGVIAGVVVVASLAHSYFTRPKGTPTAPAETVTPSIDAAG